MEPGGPVQPEAAGAGKPLVHDKEAGGRLQPGFKHQRDGDHGVCGDPEDQGVAADLPRDGRGDPSGSGGAYPGVVAACGRERLALCAVGAPGAAVCEAVHGPGPDGGRGHLHAAGAGRDADV